MATPRSRAIEPCNLSARRARASALRFQAGEATSGPFPGGLGNAVCHVRDRSWPPRRGGRSGWRRGVLYDMRSARRATRAAALPPCRPVRGWLPSICRSNYRQGGMQHLEGEAGRITRRRLIRLLAGAGLAAAGGRLVAAAPAGRLGGDIAPVHDPCIAACDGRYYVFSTGHAHEPEGLLPWRVSDDLFHWEYGGAAFEAIPGWAEEAVPGTRGLWAPDIVQVAGEYRLYYSCSTFGSNRSVIGLAT